MMRDRETEELIQLVTETNQLLEKQSKLLEAMLERLPSPVKTRKKKSS